jgi:MtrB/PioB family decaheme-associated outer membrane protein
MRKRLKSSPARWLLAAALLDVMDLAGAAQALADSSATGYGGPGNVLNPQGQLYSRGRDINGLSVLDDVTRTPTGLMYPLPFLTPEMKQSETNPDWWMLRWAEAGYIGTFGKNRGAAALKEYGAWNSGPLLTSIGFMAENRKTALHVSALGQNVGREDQYYQVEIGRYGVFNTLWYFDSIPHTYSTTAKSLWDGVGSNRLTLKPGLTPAQSTATQVNAVAAAADALTLKITREKAGSALSYNVDENTELFMRGSVEMRKGTQPISATFGYPFQNGATQIIQPIDYQTYDITAGVRYKEKNLLANFAYAGSFFHNQNRELVWDNPGLNSINAPGMYIPPVGQLSLPPDNYAHSFKGDMALVMSPASRLTGSLSYTMMRQDDGLLAPTLGSGIIASGSDSINLDQWNSTGALSQRSADAAIDVLNFMVQYQYKVSPDLGLTLEARGRNEDNRTNYVAFNPQTGQYGYIAIDGGLAPFIPSQSGIYRPNQAGSRVQIRNMPFANDRLTLKAKADYRLDSHLKLDLSYTNDAIDHSVREVTDSNDHIGRLQISTTGYEWGTARLSYEYARRTGSDYMSNPYGAYYSTSLPGYIPATSAGDVAWVLSDLRKFDMADRTQHVVRGQSNYILSPRSDLQVTGSLKLTDYDAAYGLRSTRAWDASTAYSYQLSAATKFTSFLTYQNQNRDVANINASGQGVTGEAGGRAYPLANGWTETVGSDIYTAGLNGVHSWGDFTLNLDYVFAHAKTAMNYRFASTEAFFNVMSAAQAGSGFPAITYNSHMVKAELRHQLTETVSYRVFYRFNQERVVDFHYTGLTAGTTGDNTYLGVRPENYAAQTIGFFVQYTF